MPHTAVLFIHGIIGTPRHFTEMIPLACQVPEHFTVKNITLDGHGGTVDDFAHTSMARWKAQVEKEVRELSATHQNLLVVAHSMGTLFAIEQAVKYPERIKGLFLLACPLQIRPRWVNFTNAVKVISGKISPEDKMGMAALRSYGIEPDKRVWKYLKWMPRYMELFKEARSVREILPEVTTPCRVYLSGHDEMVSQNTYKFIKNFSTMRVEMLEESSHYLYSEKDAEIIKKNFSEFMLYYK